MAIFLFFSLTLSTYAHDFQIIENGRTYWYNLIYNGNGNNKSAQITYQGASYESTNHSQYSGNIEIPSSVYYRTNRYQVISINHHTFWNRRTTSVSIPSTVVEIGSYAFGYSPLKYIKIDNTSPENISVNSNTFFGINFDECKLIVPCGCKNAYANAPYWSQFKIIEESCEEIDIILSTQDLELFVGDKEKITATVLPENTTDKTVTWTSDNETIAAVSADGTVTAVSVGIANITATCGDATATCKVTVNPVSASGITLSAQDMILLVGQTDKLTATVLPENTTDKTVTWTSDNETIAAVSADGTVTAVSVGIANITATCGDATATCKVTVNPVSASGITLSAQDMILLVGQTDKLTATVLPENTTDKTVTWTSDNETIAAVSADGTVTAVAVGKSTITATTTNGLKAICKITVIHRDVPEPEATINGELFNILSGEALKLKVNYKGGLESGWLFDWRIDDSQQSASNKTEYEFAESAVGEYRVSVHVVNNCDGELIYDNTFIIIVNVWARPELPGEDDIDVITQVSAIGSDNVVRVRQNDMLLLHVTEGQGGYDNGWTYNWSSDGKDIGEGTEVETIATMKDGEVKAIERRTYSVNVKNTSPDGTVWAENTLSITTDVYRRPITPSSLVRKGDGTTHTFICMLAVSDNQLSPLGYSFVYGYDATDGSEHEIARTTKRYCRASEQVYNNPSNRFWVYAVWTYDDGCTVSSGKRYLDGSADEEFNASVFDPSQTGTRGTDFSNSTNWINVLGKSVGISVDSDSDTFISVFTAGGIMIRSLTVEAGTSVREQIDLSTLSDGIYIVNVTSGNEAVSRKFIIK